MSDALLTYSQAGERICGIGAEAVADLVRKGKLRAKTLIVRGQNKRPRKGVLASEVDRYLRELPEPDADGKAPEPKRFRSGVRDAALRKELESCVKYI